MEIEPRYYRSILICHPHSARIQYGGIDLPGGHVSKSAELYQDHSSQIKHFKYTPYESNDEFDMVTVEEHLPSNISNDFGHSAMWVLARDKFLLNDWYQSLKPQLHSTLPGFGRIDLKVLSAYLSTSGNDSRLKLCAVTLGLEGNLTVSTATLYSKADSISIEKTDLYNMLKDKYPDSSPKSCRIVANDGQGKPLSVYTDTLGSFAFYLTKDAKNLTAIHKLTQEFVACNALAVQSDRPPILKSSSAAIVGEVATTANSPLL